MAAGVDAEEDEQQEGEAPEGGTAVGEEGQGDADDGGEAEHHADIDEDMEEEDRKDTIAVDAAEGAGLALGDVDEAQDEGEEQQQHTGGTEEAFLLADGAEDEVGVLLGHVLQLGLRAVEEALALEAAGAYGYLALMDVVARIADVVVEAQQDVDAGALVGGQAFEHGARSREEGGGTDGEGGYPEVVAHPAKPGLQQEEDDEDGRERILHIDDVEGDDEDGESQHGGGHAETDAEGP